MCTTSIALMEKAKSIYSRIMEQWEKDFRRHFVTKKGDLDQIRAVKIMRFIRELLKKERSRDKLQEVVDYVKESKSHLDLICQHVLNNKGCECIKPPPIVYELGIDPGSSAAIILWALEKDNEK